MAQVSEAHLHNALFLMACSYQASHVNLIWKFKVPDGFGYRLVELLQLKTSVGFKAYGFVMEDSHSVVVAFKDSSLNLFDVAMDLNIYQVPFSVVPAGGKTHGGFTYAYGCIRKQLLKVLSKLHKKSPKKKLYITGHSSGAALATLAALDVAVNTPFKSPKVYTSASPRVGDAQFVRTYNQKVKTSYRVVNEHDIVPLEPHSHFPRSFDKAGLFYRHVGKVLPISFQCKGKSNMSEIPLLKNHSLQNYFNVLSKKSRVFSEKMCRSNSRFCPKKTANVCENLTVGALPFLRKKG